MKAFLLIPFAVFSFKLQARLVESIKAQVGEEIISQIALSNFKLQLQKKLTPPSLLLKTLYKPSQLIKNEETRLNFMIERNLLAQLAQQQNISIDKTTLNKELKSLQGALSNTQFSKKLKRATLSLKSFKEYLNTNLQIDFLLSQSVLSKISISDQDIESYHFTKHKKPLFKAFEYEFASLSFPENKKALVLKNLKKSFIKNLDELSQNLNLEYKTSKLKGNQISQIFKEELDKLSVSQVSSLLLVGNRYYLLQLKWKAPLTSPQERKIKARIEKILFDRKLNQELRQWIDEKKNQFFIKQNFL